MFGGTAQWGATPFRNRTQKFQDYFRCYPIAMMPGKDRESANYGGKIFLPPSALQKLSMLHISYPMLFQLKSEENDNVTYGGVLEFIAEEGRVYLPQWIIETLDVGPGSLLEISSCDLPLGKFVKFEPQSVDFLDISDPRAVLERSFQNFSTLTVGDVFKFSYNDKTYGMKVLEVKPDLEDKHSVCCVETDIEVDFAPPVGYVDPSTQSDSNYGRAIKTPGTSASSTPAPMAAAGTMAQSIGYSKLAQQTIKSASKNTFSGGGQKLSGKAVKPEEEASLDEHFKELVGLGSTDTDANPQPLRLPFGQLFFGFPLVPVKPSEDDEETQTDEQQQPQPHFSGAGQSLRESRKRKERNSSAGAAARGTPKKPTSPEMVIID